MAGELVRDEMLVRTAHDGRAGARACRAHRVEAEAGGSAENEEHFGGAATASAELRLRDAKLAIFVSCPPVENHRTLPLG